MEANQEANQEAKFTYRRLCEWVAVEALYRIIRELMLSKNFVLERARFLHMTFTVATSVDGLLTLGGRGLPINLIMRSPAPLNERMARLNLQ
jgi:hypothetical protein